MPAWHAGAFWAFAGVQESGEQYDSMKHCLLPDPLCCGIDGGHLKLLSLRERRSMRGDSASNGSRRAVLPQRHHSTRALSRLFPRLGWTLGSLAEASNTAGVTTMLSPGSARIAQ